MQTYTKVADTSVQPETPTRWLCRLGPWSIYFAPGEENLVAQWAQEKTQYHTLWGGNQRAEYAEEIACLVAEGVAGELDLFGRVMRLAPWLPKKPARVQVNLPIFYPGPGFGLSWKAAYSERGETGWSVHLKLCTGGVWVAAILATEEQANDFTRTLVYGAAQYNGPKD